MHRTRTAAALLIAMTASAVSGCVSVNGPAAPHSPSRPGAATPPPAPEAGADSEPRLVTSPAHEALRMMEAAKPPESRGSLRSTAPERRPASPAPAAEGTGRAPGGDRDRADGTGGSRPADRTPSDKAPALPRSGAPRSPGADLCGLGEQYGQWAPDSPQARICRGAYGS